MCGYAYRLCRIGEILILVSDYIYLYLLYTIYRLYYIGKDIKGDSSIRS